MKRSALVPGSHAAAADQTRPPLCRQAPGRSIKTAGRVNVGGGITKRWQQRAQAVVPTSAAAATNGAAAVTGTTGANACTPKRKDSLAAAEAAGRARRHTSCDVHGNLQTRVAQALSCHPFQTAIASIHCTHNQKASKHVRQSKKERKAQKRQKDRNNEIMKERKERQRKERKERKAQKGSKTDRRCHTHLPLPVGDKQSLPNGHAVQCERAVRVGTDRLLPTQQQQRRNACRAKSQRPGVSTQTHRRQYPPLTRETSFCQRTSNKGSSASKVTRRDLSSALRLSLS
jgi:hypothetical protein